MNVLEYVKTALVTLKTQKVRSLLTTLGIVVGVMTVVTMIAIVEGMNRYVYKVLGTIGSNTIYIQKHKWEVMGEGNENPEEVTKRRNLTVEDAEAISELPSVSRAVPFQSVWTGRMKIAYKAEEVQMNAISGGGFQYTSLAGFEVARGRDLLPNDQLFRRQVCLVGKYVVENLFKKGEDPLGKEINMRGRKFQIVGVLKERGSFFGENMDRAIIIPLTTLQKLFRVRGPWAGFMSLNILAQIERGFSLEETMEDVESLLRKRRALKFDQENDFALNTQQMIVDVYKKLTSGIFLAMIGIASLALLVGGIGIMNIMLVSVLERIREIGIRIAVGAKRSDILKQFLIEALVLTLVGGFIGVFLGFGLAKIISLVTPLPSSMPLWSIALAIGFSLLTGLFFGIYPASRAARLDPIEALRYE